MEKALYGMVLAESCNTLFEPFLVPPGSLPVKVGTGTA